MPGLDPGIHRKKALQSKGMDCRVKPGNDAVVTREDTNASLERRGPDARRALFPV
jgi:hypothetical protein